MFQNEGLEAESEKASVLLVRKVSGVFFCVIRIQTSRRTVYSLLSCHCGSKMQNLTLVEFLQKFPKKIKKRRFVLFECKLEHQIAIDKYDRELIEKLKKKTFPYNCKLKSIRRKL